MPGEGGVAALEATERFPPIRVPRDEAPASSRTWEGCSASQAGASAGPPPMVWAFRETARNLAAPRGALYPPEMNTAAPISR